MTTYSDQFIWNIVRNQSSFKVQKKQYKFSNHPCSFNQKYNFTNSGIASQSSVGLKKDTKEKNFNKPNKFVSQKGFETRNKESKKKYLKSSKKTTSAHVTKKRLPENTKSLVMKQKKRNRRKKKLKFSTTRKNNGSSTNLWKKKTATAVARCKKGKGLIKVNGVPLHLVQPEPLRLKLFEPILLIGNSKFDDLDIRIRVSGGGQVSRVYAIRQAIAKSVVAYHQKYVDEMSKRDIKKKFLRYDRSLLVSDPRRCEMKKFGGRGARARRQKSYR